MDSCPSPRTHYSCFEAHPTWSCCASKPGSPTGGIWMGRSDTEINKYMACSLFSPSCSSFFATWSTFVHTYKHLRYQVRPYSFVRWSKFFESWGIPPGHISRSPFLFRSQKNTPAGLGWHQVWPRSMYCPRRSYARSLSTCPYLLSSPLGRLAGPTIP